MKTKYVQALEALWDAASDAVESGYLVRESEAHEELVQKMLVCQETREEEDRMSKAWQDRGAENEALRATLKEWKAEARTHATEIERMESSLRFAAGVLSTMGQFRSWTPQDVYDWLKRSAMGGKEDK